MLSVRWRLTTASSAERVRCSAWLGVRSDWVKGVESEFSVGVALPKGALGNGSVSPGRTWPKLPVGREDKQPCRRICEKQTDEVEECGKKRRLELQKTSGRSVSATLAEKLVCIEWPLVAEVVAEWTAEVVNTAAKLIEVALKHGWLSMREKHGLGTNREGQLGKCRRLMLIDRD